MKKSVLIVDDQQDILDIMLEILSYEHFEVACVSGLHQFYNEIDANPPDLIILDLRLKECNGGELCQQLKADTRTRHIPVIIMSAYIPPGVDICKEYRCDVFIPKPFDLDDLLQKISLLIQAGAILKNR